MTSFFNRRATILPSTLTFALFCHAGFAAAQSPEGWPFDDKDSSKSASQQSTPQPKSAVQQRLEELYKRDGRPLPNYMQKDGSQTDHTQPVLQQQSASQQQPAQPAYHQVQQPAPLVSPAPIEPPRPVVSSQGSIQQQLSDYYSSQGKTMPGTQRSWNSAEPPQIPVTGYATQGAQPDPAPQTAPQPRLIDRLNPFRGFWHKDDSTVPPQTATATYGSAPVTYGSPAAPPTYSQYSGGSASQPAPAPLSPPIVHAPATPRPYVMTVELGPRAPISQLATPVSPSPQPTVPATQPLVATEATAPPPSVAVTKAPATKPAAPAKEPVVAAKAPSAPAQPAIVASQQNDSGTATVRDEPAPFDKKSESAADQKSAPYTGLPLQDTNDAVNAADPTKVTTANANEPADRPRQAPTPAVDIEQPGKATLPPSLSSDAAPQSPPAVQKHAAIQVAQEPHTKAPAPSEPIAPKAFEARQPATHMHQAAGETAKTHKIAEHTGQQGLKGFCPVALHERRQLVDAVPVYSSIYHNRRYYFSSAEAQSRFDQQPEKYAPVAGGIDVVAKVNSDQTVEGTLDFAVWYKDRLFLFSSPESVEAFSLNPLPYASHFLKAN
jgi:YHS domain-containing protein